MGALLRCAAIWLALAFAFAAALVPVTARAQQKITFANARTVTVTVTVGKSQDIHTDQSLVDIMAGDPDVADVNPLTDHALSILGKKIGTTRVTVYGQDKKVVGIFDIEVSYDVTRLAAEIAHFTGGGIKVSSIDGRIMLSGTSPDAVTLDKAAIIAKQFAPDIINTVQVTRAQQVMLEVRFIEASREASRELGVQWNVLPRPGHRESVIANIGAQQPSTNLPVTPLFDNRPIASLATPSGAPAAAAGIIGTATSPFGFLATNFIAKGLQIDMMLNALEERGLARRLAEPNLVALSG